MTQIGKRLALLMETLGISQSALAEKIGATQAILSMYSSGARNMPRSTAMAFQAALGVRWQWLLNGDGDTWLILSEWRFASRIKSSSVHLSS